MKRLFIVCFLMLICLFPLTLLAQETLTITTYYPAPFGVYQRLVTQTLGVGDTNASGGIDASDAPDPADIDQQGQVWIAGNVGIATVTPQNALDVGGGVVVGSGYAGVHTAPLNGLLVEGNVGIGTTNPLVHLHLVENQPRLALTDAPSSNTLMLRVNQKNDGSYVASFYYPETSRFMDVSTDRLVEMLGRFRIPVRSSNPSNPVTGEIWLVQ